jgi:hypothetical protein
MNTTFHSPEVPGLQILSILAAPLYNYTVLDYTTITMFVSPRLCSVNVTHTHPGYNNTVTVFHRLPLEGWNGRVVGIGGGGWAGTISYTSAIEAFRRNYASAGTDTWHVH